MRFLPLITLLSPALATLLLALLPYDTLKKGETYEIEYLMNKPYTLRLELVRKGTEPNIAWTSVATIFEDVEAKPCGGTYEVKVDKDWPTSKDGEQYAFWISGMESDAVNGYADLTDWFSITDQGGDASPGQVPVEL